MVFRNILYKEWKAHRTGFFLMVLAAILVSAFLRPRVAVWIYFWLLLVYSGGLGSVFAAEAKTIDFLDAKPITRTNLWLAKIFSTVTLWSLTVLVILGCFLLLMKRNEPSSSILSILLNPHYLFIVLICLNLCLLSLFVSTFSLLKAEATETNNVKGLAILGGMIILWFLVKRLHIVVDIDPFDFRHETLSLFITYLASMTVFSIVSYLAFVHRETFATDILRAKTVYYFLLLVIVTVVLVTLRYLVSIPVLPENVKFISDIVVSGDGKQIAFSAGRTVSEKQTWVIRNKGANLRRISDRFSKPIALVKQGDGHLLILRSNRWLYGPEIWVGGTLLSEKDYRHKVYAGMPYLSPDKDRVAYVREVCNWGQGNKKKYVAIASVDGFEVPYEIWGGEEFDISPVGWAPNGNRFYFRKVSSVGKQKQQDSLWAIDRNAQALEMIIEDFSAYQMESQDLAEDGDWVSLVSRDETGYLLWIMNTETKETIKIGSSQGNFPARAWSLDGKRFAYTKLSSSRGDISARTASDYGVSGIEQVNVTCYLYVLKVTDGQIENVLTKTLPVILELKWSPDAKKLLFRTVAYEGGEKLGLVDIDNERHVRTITDKLADGFQYDWLDNENIVYARGGKLIAMNIPQLTENQLFPPVKKSE